ncbi:MAG: hypothetical protein HYZ54_04830 [Ignavibacteriae bacterium]|nr:hypothetical protein [Ignavibacteriota bacterium]
MKWKNVSITALLLIIPFVIVWFVQGKNIYTKDKKQVITKTKDEIFGTDTEKIEWVDEFQLGLLPGVDDLSPKLLASVAVPSGILIAVSLFGFFMNYKQKHSSVK